MKTSFQIYYHAIDLKKFLNLHSMSKLVAHSEE